jgi:hypothetical protein
MKKQAFVNPINPILMLIVIVLIASAFIGPARKHFDKISEQAKASEKNRTFLPYQYATTVPASKLEFDSYVIAYSAEFELVEDLAYDDRWWAFYKKFDVGESAKIGSTYKLPADYYYGNCTKQEWIRCRDDYSIFTTKECFCDDEDDEKDAYIELLEEDVSDVVVAKAKKLRLGAVDNLDNVYNLRLVTYKGGKKVCSVSTSSGKLTDWDKDDLIGNEANCKDSPTWIQCPGIKVSYCTKTNYYFGVGVFEGNYYFEETVEGLQNRAGIVVYVGIDPEKFTEESSSVSRS